MKKKIFKNQVREKKPFKDVKMKIMKITALKEKKRFKKVL